MLAVACTETWDEHYDLQESDASTLWQAIGQEPELSRFAQVVKATGYDDRLSSSQMFTVFAPTNEYLSEADVEKLIGQYETERAAGIKDDDNSVVKQFVRNHIALYNHSIAPGEQRVLTMMNGKYMSFSANAFGSSAIGQGNRFYANGVLFTIGQPQPYFANVYEQLSMTGETDSLYQFLNRYSVYAFSADESVAGDIVNGKTIYLDSVFHRRNAMLSEYGYIDREDSCYWTLVPTDTLWSRLYSEYQPYFNYIDGTPRRDSLVNVRTQRAIADGTIFNVNAQLSLADSLVSTHYQRLYRNRTDYSEPRYYRYFRPMEVGGILAGSRAVSCSNGRVLVQNHWPIDKTETFLQQIKVEAEVASNVDTIIQAHEPLTVRAVPMSNPFYGKVSANYFAEAQPLTTASSTTVRYRIPDQLSNVGYDIYAVFVPAIAFDEKASADDRLPCRVRMTITYLDQEGNEQSASLRDPVKNAVNFETTPDVIDSVLVASNYVFPTCALGLENPQVTLRIASNVSASQSSKYTRTLRLDCIILKPHL